MTGPQYEATQAEAAQDETAGPLAGISVIDLTRALAGPYGTMLLGELGARIVKVEPPGGDPAREIGPHVAGQSAYFMSLNRGKESIVLDLKDAADRKIFEAMVPPDRSTRTSRRYEESSARLDVLNASTAPRLAATSGFGQTGPYRPPPGLHWSCSRAGS